MLFVELFLMPMEFNMYGNCTFLNFDGASSLVSVY